MGVQHGNSCMIIPEAVPWDTPRDEFGVWIGALHSITAFLGSADLRWTVAFSTYDLGCTYRRHHEQLTHFC